MWPKGESPGKCIAEPVLYVGAVGPETNLDVAEASVRCGDASHVLHGFQGDALRHLVWRCLAGIVAVSVGILLPSGAVVAHESDPPSPHVLIVTTNNLDENRQATVDFALERLGMELRRWNMTYEDGGAADLNPYTLEDVDVVMFLNTRGEFLAPDQREALQEFIELGGGFIGTGSAAATETNWPFFHQLVGAMAVESRVPETANTLNFHEEAEITDGMADDWQISDRWLSFDRDPEEAGATLLAWLDSDHPVAWQHNVDRGRSFYTSLGSAHDTWAEREFGHLLRQATWWAAGEEPPLRQDTSRSAPNWPYITAFIFLVAAVAVGGVVAVARMESPSTASK